MRKFIEYLRPYFSRMLLGLTIKFTGTIMDLLLPWILAHMIDYIVPQKNVRLITLWGLMMVIASIVAVATNIIANRMATRVARDTTERIRHDLFQKTVALSCSQVDDFTIPSLTSRLTSDTYHVHHMIGMMQRLGVRAPILLVGGLMVTLTLDPVLALVLLGVLPFISLVIFFVSKKGIALYQKLQQSVDDMVRIVRENITGIRVIKALSKGTYEKGRFKSINSKVMKDEKRVGLTMAITNPMMNLLLNLGLTLVILVGAYRVNDGLTQPGKIIAFLTYFTIILNAMLSISRIFIIFSKGSASFQRITEVLETPEDLLIEDHLSNHSDYHISFEGVSFSYHKQQNNLTDINFQLKPGETLGIIGPTGSGKSTILKLLMRFYDVDQGTVRINGQDIKSIPRETLHTKFGVVLQNDTLFAETIAENISFGRRLPEQALREAAGFAQAREFIEAQEREYQHQLTVKGSNLSGGQRQRLLISRALAARPEILLLDDCTSALDYQTDARLRRALHNHFQDTTTIIVAQRISSIMDADHIMVLDEGRIIGYGTHQELMENCESYAEISRSQMGVSQYA